MPIRSGLFTKDLTALSRGMKREMTLLAKWLIEDFDDPSNRQISMIILTIPLVISCLRYGLQVAENIEKGKPTDASWDHYHSALGRIDRTFVSIGYKKNTIKKVMDLASYLQEKYPEHTAKDKEVKVDAGEQ